MSSVNVGSRFGRLVVCELKQSLRDSGSVKRIAVCRCDCGQDTEVEKYNLTSGNTSQCQECAKISRAKNRKRHGHSWNAVPKGSLESKCYYTWQAMKRRCLNPSDSHYKHYGARGIAVCQRWADSYEAFFSDMGLPPTIDHQIDRQDNDSGYFPENCQWVSRKDNARNRRNNRVITAFGETLNLSQWSEKTGVKRETISRRLNKGMLPEDALSRQKQKPGVQRQVSTPDGVFDTLTEAAKASGLSVSGMHSRIKSKNYPDWHYN